jgi:predicted dehydrogenase
MLMVLSGPFEAVEGWSEWDWKPAQNTQWGKGCGADQAMGTSALRIGIAGCGRAARIHLARLLSLPEVAVVGFADADLSAAALLAEKAATNPKCSPISAFADHRELIHEKKPDALCVFTPHRWHYRLAMDALQAGCHLFIEKPLSTNVQEAADIVGLARGRSLKVAVGHQYRLCPSLVETRRRLTEGTIGTIRLVTATMACTWLAAQQGEESSWRFDRRLAGGGVVADAGDHLIDALLWTTGRAAQEVCAVQNVLESGLDVVTAAALRLTDGTPVTLAVSGVSPGPLFELNYFGESGRIRATDQTLEANDGTGSTLQPIPLPSPRETIDGNFVSALIRGSPLCCPAEEALDTVRLIEGIVRSAPTRQFVRLQ